MGLSESLLSPSEKQIRLWHLFSEFYQLNFKDDKEEWLEYLYDLGIVYQLNSQDEKGYLIVPNPSEEGVLKISEELAAWFSLNGMPWKINNK